MRQQTLQQLLSVLSWGVCGYMRPRKGKVGRGGEGEMVLVPVVGSISKHWFTTSFPAWREGYCGKARLGVCVCVCVCVRACVRA